MDINISIWIAITIVMILIEWCTLGLTTIWFACGSFVSAIAAGFGASGTVQIILFFVVSIILLSLLRPYSIKYFNKNIEKTNTDLLIGKEAYVYEDIDYITGSGRVKVGSMEWKAKCDERILAGTIVIIKEIQGASLIVTKKYQKERSK